MLHHLAENGTMAVVLPHGILFRSGTESYIRKYIIERQNYLDTVIGLPSNLFYGTSIPATILIFKKCRREDQSILFIEASRKFKKGKNQNYLDDQHVKKIFETYKNRKEIKRYSHNASIDEIKENDFNLNIPRYVDTYEENERIDIQAVVAELSGLKKEETKLKKDINKTCKILGIKIPF